MENKLINLNILEAKNVICVWNALDDSLDPLYGIERPDAQCGFMIPQYIVVGLFDDGTTQSAGIFGLSSFNDDDECQCRNHGLFCFHHFLYYVDLNYAKSFVLFYTFEEYDGNEIEAKAGVYEDLLKAGVEISDEAKQYLTTYE